MGMNVPGALSEWIPSLLDDEAVPFYAQAASVDEEGSPDVRTVHLRYLHSTASIGFACHKDSPKWRHLSAEPRIKCCWFHPRKQIQLRFGGRISVATDPKAVEESWTRTHDWIKAEYWERDRSKITEIHPSFGVFTLEVQLWDLYRIDLDDPLKSTRSLFHLRTDGSWDEEPRGTLL